MMLKGTNVNSETMCAKSIRWWGWGCICCNVQKGTMLNVNLWSTAKHIERVLCCSWIRALAPMQIHIARIPVEIFDVEDCIIWFMVRYSSFASCTGLDINPPVINTRLESANSNQCWSLNEYNCLLKFLVYHECTGGRADEWIFISMRGIYSKPRLVRRQLVLNASDWRSRLWETQISGWVPGLFETIIWFTARKLLDIHWWLLSNNADEYVFVLFYLSVNQT